MYKVSTPLINLQIARAGRENAVKTLKEIGVERIFFVLGADSLLNGARGAELAALRENCAFFRRAGFEVGAWLWAFQVYCRKDFTFMKAPDGSVSNATVCPTDETYRDLMADYIGEIAGCGVQLIMFDDDFRCGFQDMGFGCVCDNHIREIQKLTGETLTLPLLKKHMLAGGANKYRSAFVKANGRALEAFAAKMREAVDQTDKTVRLGFCACISSWDLDGTHPDTLARILAGETKPFYRLIGAPYWGAMKAWGNTLGDVIDVERAESARRKDAEIEIFSEGDTFPRPRFETPASYLECFDTALRAADCTDGILKYMFDYTAGMEYETGYYEAMVRNRPFYPEIARVFSAKRCAGVRVYDKPDKYETYAVPEKLEGDMLVQELAFSAAARFLTKNSIPSVYEGPGVCGIAFGDDARALLPGAFSSGLILDLPAAQLLTERGTDVGIEAVGDVFSVGAETFAAQGTKVGIFGEAEAKKLTLAPEAEILSFAEAPDGKTYPLSFFYVNGAGQRFLVYAFDGYFSNQRWFGGYLRAAQVRAFAERCGEKLPAICPGHPGLYLLVKTAGDRVAVGLWNLHPDPVFAPEVAFPQNIRILSTVRCEAAANGSSACLSDIPAFDFAAVEVQFC